jgi:hypothetical protein
MNLAWQVPHYQLQSYGIVRLGQEHAASIRAQRTSNSHQELTPEEQLEREFLRSEIVSLLTSYRFLAKPATRVQPFSNSIPVFSALVPVAKLELARRKSDTSPTAPHLAADQSHHFLAE